MRLLKRAGSLLLWIGVLILAAFGIAFSFANYPWLESCIVLCMLTALGYSERRRRIAAETTKRGRARNRAAG
jgi:hypothetical protein